MRALVVIAATALAAVSPASAQDRGSRMTRDYVATAGESDAFEMREADSALAESQDPQVRSFAQMMIDDHRRLSQALTEATARSGLTPPPTIVGAGQEPLLGALQSARGADFDRTYWRHQALAHRSALVTTQMYAANGDDRAVKTAAANALPIITAHLAMAERMQAQSGAGQ